MSCQFKSPTSRRMPGTSVWRTQPAACCSSTNHGRRECSVGWRQSIYQTLGQSQHSQGWPTNRSVSQLRFWGVSREGKFWWLCYDWGIDAVLLHFSIPEASYSKHKHLLSQNYRVYCGLTGAPLKFWIANCMQHFLLSNNCMNLGPGMTQILKWWSLIHTGVLWGSWPFWVGSS